MKISKEQKITIEEKPVRPTMRSSMEPNVETSRSDTFIPETERERHERRY